ncbi:MAG TPA: hypothetical protein VFW19_00105 [Allosphingosinicella sp.]|nr:hypothetical protein [Allosphingosinicella sp.]
MPDDDAPTREQLVAAREAIIAQLDELSFRAEGIGSLHGAPPDYQDLIAEFQQELREIDALLDGTKLPDARGFP